MRARLRPLVLCSGLVAASISTPSSATATAAVSVDDTVQIDPATAKWKPGEKTNKKDRKFRDGKGTKRPGTLTVTIENGRGSVFVNGRYAGTAPVEGFQLPAGNNDVEIRDGMILLAEGVLFVPFDTGVKAVVRHP